MYLALYRKFRPKNFSDVISQEYIVTTLKNEIKSGHVGHAYLFTGSRGTGKTTCAKIFSKAVNCLHPVDGEPCLKCDICKGLEDGTILDIEEMDAASNNSVEDIRALREEANYTPVSCKYRVYIIDEAHMLTASAFNAFLKIMEEPPSHVIFILATTEAHKIPPTILSRCQRFDFRRLKREDIAKRLLEIAKKEEFTLEKDAALFIAKIADGAMRDALSILEQCAAISHEITLEQILKVMGIPAKDQLFSIGFALLNRDVSKAIAILDELYQGSKDFDRVCQELISVFRDTMIYQTSGNKEQLFVSMPDEVEKVESLSSSSSPEQILSILTHLQEALDNMAKTQSKRLEMELCFVRICSDLSKDTQGGMLGAEIPPKQIVQKPEILKKEIKPEPSSPKVEEEKISETFIPTAEEIPLPEEIPVQEEPAEKEKSEIENPASRIVKEDDGDGEKPSEEISEKPKPSEQSNEMVPLACWNHILEDLQEDPSHVMIGGILRGSQALTIGDKLFIQSAVPLSAERVLAKKDVLDNLIQKYTGKKYRFFIKSKKEEKNSTEKDNMSLETLLQRAEDMGIPIESEK